jgi:hypothetical protein
MDANEIKFFFAGEPRFLGVFARDEFPDIKERPSSFILNEDTRLLDGSHWVAIYVGTHTTEYFDPYGLPPRFPDTIKSLWKLGNPISYNDKVIQSVSSYSCGLFSTHYLKNRLNGISPCQILETFCHPECNDYMV